MAAKTNVKELLIELDGLHRYHRLEAGGVPLLTPAGEKKLFIRRDRLRTQLAGATDGDGIELQEKIRDLEIQIITANVRLVWSIADRFAYQVEFTDGLSRSDLEQEGYMGLIRAVERFQISRGHRFSTYATWWIRQAVSRAFPQYATTIRIPVHTYELIGRIEKGRHLLQAAGLPATPQTLAEELDLPIDTVIKATESLNMVRYIESLDRPVNEDAAAPDTFIADFIEDTGVDVADLVSLNELKEVMAQVLETLSPREARIIKLRFGLEDGVPQTLEQVAQKFDLTRERIRQIEAGVFRKIRHPRRARRLKEFI